MNCLNLVNSMRHKELRFGQFVQRNNQLFIVIGTSYKVCYHSLLNMTLDELPVLLYQVYCSIKDLSLSFIKDMFLHGMNENNFELKYIESLEIVDFFTEKEFKDFQDEFRYWYLKSKLVLSENFRQRLKEYQEPEENYKLLEKEKKKLYSFQQKFNTKMRIALEKKPTTKSVLKENCIYIQNAEWRSIYLFFYRNNYIFSIRLGSWVEQSSFGEQFLTSFYSFDCVLGRMPSGKYINTNIDITKSDYLDKTIKRYYEEE